MSNNKTHRCPPCTGECNQGRDCPAQRDNVPRNVVLALLIYLCISLGTVLGAAVMLAVGVVR